MAPKRRLVLLFASAAFIAAAVSTLVLWELFHGPRYIDMVTGPYGSRALVTFPFVAAGLAGLYASLFEVQRFGTGRGALVALLSFVSFCIMVNALTAGGMKGFLALLLVASALFGWPLVILGAVIGWFFRRNVRSAL
jgi:hypothetical protein